MYCSRLSVLQNHLNEDEIEKINNYFSSLIGSAQNNITVSKVMTATNLPASIVTNALTICKENGILNVAYSIRCPHCGMLLKKYSKIEEVADASNSELECYGCENIVEVKADLIELIYSLVDEDCVFEVGQQNDFVALEKSVAQENTMAQIFNAGGVNSYLFNPTDDDYKHLSKLFSNIYSPQKNTKSVGDTLESLCRELFNLCPAFKAAGIKTTTNQIDCFVRNKLFLDYGVLKDIGSKFFVECKNETKTPSGTYMSKLHSIISTTNAGAKGECIKFGIIISKLKAPSTFKDLSVKYYLSNGIVIISIHAEELKKLIDCKGNLLELIERKICEIKMDSNTDLVKSGLYDI